MSVSEGNENSEDDSEDDSEDSSSSDSNNDDSSDDTLLSEDNKPEGTAIPHLYGLDHSSSADEKGNECMLMYNTISYLDIHHSINTCNLYSYSVTMLLFEKHATSTILH